MPQKKILLLSKNNVHLIFVSPQIGVYYSLDDGKTKFFDLLQMVEFYQLNRGSLHTKLTHYIVRYTVVNAPPGTAAAAAPAAAAAAAKMTASTTGSAGSQSPNSRYDMVPRELFEDICYFERIGSMIISKLWGLNPPSPFLTKIECLVTLVTSHFDVTIGGQPITFS